MSPTVYKKIGACQTADAVLCRADVILCQGLNAVNKEYLFEEISLEECCREVLDEYRLYLEEKQILVQLDLKEKTVLSDRKSLCFYAQSADREFHQIHRI